MHPCLKKLLSSSLLISSRPSVRTVAAFSNTLFYPRLSPLSLALLRLQQSTRSNKKYHRHRHHSTHCREGEPSPSTEMPPKTKSKNGANSVPHAPQELFDEAAIDRTRTKLLTSSAVSSPRRPNHDDPSNQPCVMYWMIRDVRTADNWAALFARSLAVRYSVPLRVVYVLPPPPAVNDTNDDEDDAPPPDPVEMSPTQRHGSFLLDGLKIVAKELARVNVPLDILRPSSRDRVGKSVHRHAASSDHRAIAVVCDMSPLKTPRRWTETQAAPLLESEGIPLYQVDAHNVVPVWTASDKREVGARTLRKKIHELFGGYCCSFPEFEGNDHLEEKLQDLLQQQKQQHDWDGYERYMKLDTTIQPVDGMTAGREAATKRWNDFLSSRDGQGLKNFDTLRNDPTHRRVCTNLSPYINAGQISFQSLALQIRALKRHANGTAAFIEEGVVRRELSDNFVYYTPDRYDSLEGAAEWARDSLELHRVDEREYLYTWKELERGETHDDLWNAGQMQLVREGKLHGFMRMYWAKKILEWTPSPSYALATAQYFNDRYAYDGNDPNGYVGVGWSIMGIHDMGWKERPVFGKIRYMNYAGCKRKFKIDAYVSRYKGAKENAAKALSDGKNGGSNNLSGKKRKAG